jgi:hypothetical protein
MRCKICGKSASVHGKCCLDEVSMSKYKLIESLGLEILTGHRMSPDSPGYTEYVRADDLERVLAEAPVVSNGSGEGVLAVWQEQPSLNDTHTARLLCVEPIGGQMKLDDELAAIKARVEAATPGPWRAVRNNAMGETWFNIFTKGDDQVLAMIGDLADKVLKCPNAELVAHAPTDISRLLKALELCRRQRDLYRNDWATGEGKPLDGDKDDATLLEILRGSE